MKNTKTNNSTMVFLSVLLTAILFFSMVVFDCGSQLRRQQVCQSGIRVTPEQVWQSFPG